MTSLLCERKLFHSEVWNLEVVMFASRLSDPADKLCLVVRQNAVFGVYGFIQSVHTKVSHLASFSSHTCKSSCTMACFVRFTL